MGTAKEHRCFACGTNWETGDRFCAECGESLGILQLALYLDTLPGREPQAPSFPSGSTPRSATPAEEQRLPGSPADYRAQLERAGIDASAIWIWDIGISLRIVNRLVVRDVFRLSDLLRLPAARQLAIRGLGPGSLDEAYGKVAALLAQGDETRERIRAWRGTPHDPMARIFGDDFVPHVESLGVECGTIALSSFPLPLRDRRMLKSRGFETLADFVPLTNLDVMRRVREPRPDLLDALWSACRSWLLVRSSPLPDVAARSPTTEDGAPPSSLKVHPDEAVEQSFTRMTNAVGSLQERPRLVLVQRFGLDVSEPRTLADIAHDVGVTRERVRQIEYKALQTLTRQRGAFVAARVGMEELCQELGLSWRNRDLAVALGKRYPRATWATAGHLRLLAAIFKEGAPDDKGIGGVEAAAVAVVSRTGPLTIEELSQRVTAMLEPTDLERFPSFDVAKRLETIGPVRRRNDGRYDLPSGSIDGVSDKRVRRLHAMVGVIERLGPSHFATIARELDDHLPSAYRLSERDVHAWLGRYDDVFVWAGRGRYGLTSHGVGIRADADASRAALPTGYRGKRRKGIGDEIAALLLEQGPLPLSEVTAHILTRFQVLPTSVLAAIQQDTARRFGFGDDRLVVLRAPEDRPAH